MTILVVSFFLFLFKEVVLLYNILGVEKKGRRQLIQRELLFGGKERSELPSRLGAFDERERLCRRGVVPRTIGASLQLGGFFYEKRNGKSV